MPTGVQFTSRSQLSGSGGSEADAHDAVAAISWARSGFLAYTVTCAWLELSAEATARADPPAPSTATRVPRSGTRSLSGVRNPDASVLPPIHFPSTTPI